jgi:hypothetical protein
VAIEDVLAIRLFSKNQRMIADMAVSVDTATDVLVVGAGQRAWFWPSG